MGTEPLPPVPPPRGPRPGEWLLFALLAAACGAALLLAIRTLAEVLGS